MNLKKDLKENRSSEIESMTRKVTALEQSERQCRQAEEALQEREDRLSKIFNHSNDAIFIIDPPNDKIMDVNPKACQILGYSKKELMAMSISDIHPKEMVQLRKFSQMVSKKGQGWTDELTCITKSGRLLPSEISASNIEISGSKYMVSMVRDITDRKQAEKALQQVNDQLELRVEKRTNELLKINKILEKEIAKRQQAEKELINALSEVEKLKNRLQAENVYLQEEIKTEYNFDKIVGNSPPLMDVLRKVQMVAPTDSTVLITGETGTGKELIARAIHNLSNRKNRPLVKVNCAAITVGLVESELFGHEKGAFTGALAQRIGRFELANGGTIFLDEVGELPLETQVKLLRVLQEQEFERVGSNKSIKVEVRIIAATNRVLSDAVGKGDFRTDLFYRLNVFPLEIPRLSERGHDIQLLATIFLKKFARKLGKPLVGISPSTMDWMMNYSWPGNIRELRNIIERAAITSETPIIEIEETLKLDFDPSKKTTGLEIIRELERTHILQKLEECDWKIGGKNGAAEVLNLPPSTLRDRMRKYNINKPT